MAPTITDVPAARISAGSNDRTVFDAGALAGLADNIRENGLAQPITVRPIAGARNRFEIVAGERRFRACTQVLGWTAMPCIVSKMSDERAAAVMLAENVARMDLDPIDEARAYQTRIDRHGWTVEDVAQRAGVSTVRVQFRLKMLALQPEYQQLVRTGQLPMGYAQTLAGAALDDNRQGIAVRMYQESSAPALGWFRRVVNGLAADQSQDALFDIDALRAPLASADGDAAVEPPHPATTTPPARGRSPRTIISHQVAFWLDAARQWADAGKPFKRQECEAAAQALEAALASFS